MPYVFQPKDHGPAKLTEGSSFGGTLGGGVSSIGGASSARSKGMISTIGAAFKSPFSQGSRAPERGAPERIEPSNEGLMPFVATAAAAPGHTLERPVAIANKASGGLIGDIISGIGGFGIGEHGPEIGDLVNVAGGALERVGSFTSAIANAPDALALRYVIEHGLRPDELMPDEIAGIGKYRPNTGGFLGIGSHHSTVKEFLTDLEKRGFNMNPDGSRMSWDDVISKIDGNGALGAFQFGDKAISDNQLVDLAFKIASDPTNLAFGLGAFGKAGQVARWATQPLLRTGLSAGGRLAPTWGVGLAKDMAQAGLRIASLPSAKISARMIQAGRVEQATLKGLGLALQAPSRLLLPGSGGIATRYARGALRTELGLLGAEYGSGAIRNVATAVTDNPENPVSGFFNEIHDVSQSLLADKPLSENLVWNMTAAFALPAVPLLKEDLSAVGRGARSRLGDPDVGIWAEHYAENPIKGTDVTLGIRRGYKQERAFLEELGTLDRAEINPRTGEFARPKVEAGDMARGREVFNGIIDHIRTRIAFKKMTDFKPIRQHYESIEDALFRNQALADDVRAYANDLAKRGQFKARELMDEFEDWAHGRTQTVVDRQGNILKNVREAVDFDLTPRQRLEQYMLWKRATTDLQSKFGPLTNGILGRAKRMTKEMIDDLSDSLRAMSNNGRVSTEAVRGLLIKYPAMFDDVSILLKEDEEFWRALMNAGRAGIGDEMVNAVKGAAPTYALDTLLPRLEKLRRVSPAAREIFHEASAAERAASAKGVPTAGGPLQTGGFREIYSIKQLRDFRAKSVGAIRQITREIDEKARAFERRWTKRGNMRAEAARLESRLNSPERSGFKRANYEEFESARQAGKRQEFLTPHNPDEFAKSRAYLSENGESGFMLSPEGDLQNVFNNGYTKGLGGKSVEAAVRAGAKTLDAYDGFLPEYYARFGFEEVARMKFVDEFAPPGWDFKKYGRPDVVFMAQTGTTKYVKAAKYIGDWDAAKTLSLETADTALAARHAATRASEQAELTALREQAKAMRKEHREAQARIDEIRTVKVDPHFLDEAGNPKVTGESLDALKEQTAFIRDNYPAYDLEPGPKVAVRFNPEDSHMAALLTERSNIARVLFDYGPLGRITRFLDALAFRPVKNSKMAHDARQMVFNRLMPMGASAKKIDLFLAKLTEAQKDWTVGKIQAPLFRGTTAMPSNKINAVAREVFEGDDKFLAAFKQRYGSTDRFHQMLDESANSMVRRVDLKKLRGQKAGGFEKIMRSGYWVWQHQLAPISDGTRWVSKFFYPMFRFQADIRWQALNQIEADSIAFFRDGAKATRFGRNPERVLRRGGRDVNISQNALSYHASRSGLPVPPKVAGEVGRGPTLPNALHDDAGAFLVNANIAPVLRRTFDLSRPETTRAVIDEFAKHDNVIQIMRRTFGEEKGTWAQQLDDMFYSFDRLGVRKSVDEAVRGVRKYEKWTQAEFDQMVPFVNKLVERNQQAFDDMLHVHLGETSRTRLERIGNSYWLYWPLSYQIKATKWMLGVLTERGFGQKTNLGGTVMLDRAAEVFRTQVRENPEFAKQAKDNELLWFAASMVLPTAPWDMGLSLNRMVRYAGGNVLGLWPAYAINDVGDVATKALEMGPIYSAELFDRFVNQYTQDKAVHNVDTTAP